MREIKFRGKRYGDGAWVYGSLYQGTKEGEKYSIILNDSGYHLAPPDDRNLAIAFAENEVNVVIPDTIGQFTGVLDKNGNEIYEGDVLSVREWKNLAFGMFNHDEMKDLSLDDCKGELLKDIKSLVYWDEGSMLATEQNGCAYYMCSFWHENTLITQPIFDIEIIGNIHDNLGLLKG